ncbi:Uncharacterized protein F383_00394 [Gossypium arboreum]|uniref:Uncharacterized protein n=1 Tax=Gossypium arboreum TaxID=29729 RepID=A0A0B0NYQ7_GOSAR|nr:Uncharacterized protein F383_00394 [Gossypium arboreum]
MVMLHGRVSPREPYDLKSVYPTVLTQPKHTGLSIGRVVGRTSVYTTVLTRPRHTDMSIGRVWHTGWHMGVWSAV